MSESIHTLLNGKRLSFAESRDLFARLIGGKLNEIEISAILTALKVKGETAAEIAGAVQAFRDAAADFPKLTDPVGDCCGTGGDGSHTVNISTAVAFLTAACGLKIAKHGNRSVSSKCGSADVLEQLGYNLKLESQVVAEAIAEDGIGFLFAPNFHQGVRFAMPVRKALASRTIFNLIGPLINPANPDYQLIGVYNPDLCKPIAETLRLLDCQSALIVHGSGLDEIAIHGPTTACRLQDGHITELTINPNDFFKESYSITDLAGGDPVKNADWLLNVLSGKGNLAHNRAIALNTAALLELSGTQKSMKVGFHQAMDTLSSGSALEKLTQFIKRTEDVINTH